MQDHTLVGLKNWIASLQHYSWAAGRTAPSHELVDNQAFNEQNSPLPAHSFPCFPPFSLFSPVLLTSHLQAAGADGLHQQHACRPAGTFWRTSWEADGSPVLSGHSPDGKHADLPKTVHAVSQLQQDRRASCCPTLFLVSIWSLSF